MRHIAALTIDKVPRDDEFKFRERAQNLVNKWANKLAGSGEGKVGAGGGVNGHANGASEPMSAGAEGAIVPESAGVTLPSTGGTTLVGEKVSEKKDGLLVEDPVGNTAMDTTLGDVTMTDIGA